MLVPIRQNNIKIVFKQEVVLMDKEIKRAKIFNYTVAIVFLLIFISTITLLGVWKWSRTFTVRKWMDNPNDRHKIVSDMLSENEIIGMTENEIIDLLGKETEFAPERHCS